MAWPDDETLPVEVWAAFGADVTADPGTWTWTDLSSRLLVNPISIRSGRSGGAGSLSPSTCSVTLDNDDAALTPLHPLSPYWPNVELGTPITVRLRRMVDDFARTTSGGWGSATSGQPWILAGPTADFSVSSGVAKQTHNVVNQIRRTVLANRLVDVEQVFDVSAPVVLTGSALVAGAVARFVDSSNYYWLRCEFNPAGTITAKISKRVGGTDTTLATVGPVSGLSYSAGTKMRIRANVTGAKLSIKIWPAVNAEPAGWTLTATDGSLTEAGSAGLQSWLVSGNTNTLPVTVSYSSYTAWASRFSGFADQWEPTYEPTGDGMRSTIRLTASGVLRRISQGEPPVRSPLRRSVQAGTSPIDYWALEDGDDATQAASVLVGRPPMTVSGKVDFAAYSPERPPQFPHSWRYGTAALPSFADGGSLSAPVSPASTGAEWSVMLLGRVDGVLANATIPLIEWQTPGSGYARWRLSETVSGTTSLDAYDDDGNAFNVLSGPSLTALGNYQVDAQQVGADVTVRLWSIGNLLTTVTVNSLTLAKISRVIINPLGRVTSGATNPDGRVFAVGHVRVYQDHNAFDVPRYTDLDTGLVVHSHSAWSREQAHKRIERLGTEEGLAVSVAPPPSGTATMLNAQRDGTILDLLRDAEDADGGALSERGWGLGYLPRGSRYNQQPDLTIDLATYKTTGRDTSVLAPTYDDANVRNEWTVSRTSGSSATVADREHQRRGVYTDSAELDLADDSLLLDHASWRLHLSTVVDLRDDAIPVDLAANPDLIDQWLSCVVGSTIRRVNLPAQYPTGSTERVVEGWTEILGPKTWRAQLVVSPARGWDVAEADGEQRVAAAAATLDAALAVGGGSLLLLSTAVNGRWTEAASDMPLDVRVGGERVTVSAIASAVTDTFTRTVSNGWGTTDSGQAWTTSGGSASDYSVVP